MQKWRNALCVATCLITFLAISCSRKEAPPATAAPSGSPVQSNTEKPNTEKASTAEVALPIHYDRHTDDLDGMVKRRNIRALVLMNPIGIFYDKGQPRGANYEALQEFQKFANEKLKTGTLKVTVTFLPVRAEQAEAALTQGMGDLIAYSLIVTPEREQRVAFTVPVEKNVQQVIVTGPNFGEVSKLEDLGGKQVYANPLTVSYQNLQQVNDTLRKEGKPLIDIKAADKNLLDDDLLQMVNAGLLPATVTSASRAKLWSEVLPNLRPHLDLVIASGQQTAWAVRKDNPQLKRMLDEFMVAHAVGTSFGNTLVRRYLQNTKWVKNSTSPEELKKFQQLTAYFQKYAAEYDFDYLMIAAQGYQESLLDQQRRNPSGAVGIMQVIPKYAAASPINVPNVSMPETNIEAGVKMLRNIEDTYFDDPKIDRLNKTLFVFASYNAGPNRIARLRKEAQEQGLDPNKWFDNVELVVAKDIGQETVTYVGNVYKYYVAYKLAVAQRQVMEKARTGKDN